jgi:transposase
MPPSCVLTTQRWGTKKNGAQAIGRSRGGLTTKIHALVDALGNPVELMLTPGQAHDLTCAVPLLEECDSEALIGDTAYDADAFIDTLAERQITPVIPSNPRRKELRPCDFALYCERNLVERFFNKLKHFRVIATRYDKLARNFLAGSPPRLHYNSPQLKTGPSVCDAKVFSANSGRHGHPRIAWS